jgi:hypothetical protein
LLSASSFYKLNMGIDGAAVTSAHKEEVILA